MSDKARSPNHGMAHPSLLDIYIVSLLDRGFETCYDLQRRGGLSLGSTVPALRRLEGAGLVRKTKAVGASKRPRNGFKLSAAGRKLACTGWIPLLNHPPSTDLDALLRLADLASHYGAKTIDIASLLEHAATDRTHLSKLTSAGKVHKGVPSLLYLATKNDWDSGRSAAEAKFLLRLAKSVLAPARKKSKTS